MEKESKYALFKYEEVDSSFIDELIEFFDSKVQDIYAFFEIKKINTKAIINIVPTKEEFDRLFKDEYGFNAPRYSRGICKKDGSINYLSIKDYDNTTHAFNEEDYDEAYKDFKKTLIHEYVHYVNQLFNKENDCGPTAIYLREGIAIYLSNQKENKVITSDFTLEDILTNNSNKKIYDAYYCLVKYLVENYDKEFVLDLFMSNRKAKEFLVEELFDKVIKRQEI